MDLRLHLRVLWRFRFLVAVGLLAGLLLGLVAYVRVGLEDGRPTFAYRQGETYASHATLFVTQGGFPWGRSIPELENLESAVAPAPADATTTEEPLLPQFADATRFATLASLYAKLATSDAVGDIVGRSGPIDGRIEATALATRDAAVPLIDLAGVADTKEGAVALTERAIRALQEFVRQRQDATAVLPENRVILTVIDRPADPELVEGRKLTRPIILFLAVVIVVVALVYVLESLRPRHRESHQVDGVRSG